MKYISKQEGFALKGKRQAELIRYSTKYKVHCGGACAHYGKIPKGCAGCLFNNVYASGIFLGCGLGLPNVCNANCKHCFTKIGSDLFDRVYCDTLDLPENWEEIVDAYIADNGPYGAPQAQVNAMLANKDIGIVSFGGEGSEPLMYLPVIERVMAHYKEKIEPHIDKSITYKLYTNGKLLTEDVILRLKEAGINELRVNPSAFGFTDEILENIELACKHFPVVTNEIGVFPKYYDNIYKLMSKLDDIGVSHLSLCQPKYKDFDVLISNEDLFSEDAICYPASNDWVVVDDGGEVEKMIKFAIDNDFKFSILDCNGILMSQEDSGGSLGKELNNIDFKEVIQ